MNISWHGWGGQGVNSAAKLIVTIAHALGFNAKVVPDNSPESMDTPLCAFSRIGEASTSDSKPFMSPDLIIAFDAAIFNRVNITEGSTETGKLLVNTPCTPLQIKEGCYIKFADVFTINAKQIMFEETGEGSVVLPMVAAVARITQLADLDAFQRHLGSTIFTRIDCIMLQKYRNASRRAYEEIIGLWRR